jgi:hypothetical protein
MNDEKPPSWSFLRPPCLVVAGALVFLAASAAYYDQGSLAVVCFFAALLFAVIGAAIRGD